MQIPLNQKTIPIQTIQNMLIDGSGWLPSSNAQPISTPGLVTAMTELQYNSLNACSRVTVLVLPSPANALLLLQYWWLETRK